MVNEVNNIIYNTLIAERAIHLPDVGTLSVVRKSAEMTSKNLIAPPRYVVEFSSCGVATSVVDAIACEGDVDQLKAEDIYSRWLEKVRTESVILIEGVGRLQNKSFVADKDFLSLFNADATPIKVKRNNNSAIYVALIATFISVGAIFGVAAWFFFSEPAAPAAETIMEQSAVMPDVVAVEDVIEDVVTEESIETIEAEVVEVVNDWTQDADIRHWVVAGSYSTEENANRAKSALLAKHNDIQCEIISLGKMYAVAVYGSAEREYCVQFMREYGDEIESIWIFTPKKFQ